MSSAPLWDGDGQQENRGIRGLFQSITTTLMQARQVEADEELGNPYINIQEEADFQDEFEQRRSRHSVREALAWAGLPRMCPEEPPPPPKPSNSFFGFGGGNDNAREAGQASLLRKLTPSFLQTEEDENIASTCCPNLGWKQRIFGCVCCVLIGQVLQFFACGSLMGVLVGHPGKFASLYSLGNFFMVSSSFFLSGPKQQCRKMSTPSRAPAAGVFLATMLLTLITVFGHAFFGRPLVILLLVILQWMAQVWYILSYIPYGHNFGKRVLRGVFRWCCTC